MKKNITINLYGSLYTIDDDAYQMLEKYLSETQRYFMSREGGDEIADDIERRIAELLAENKANGNKTVTLQDIKDIISRIGNPEEMDDDTPDTDEKTHTDSEEQSYTAGAEQTAGIPPEPPHRKSSDNRWHFFNKRKLYRNPNDKMLGGVLSGLCYYLGGNDALPWRLIFVILCFASFQVLSLIYLVCWALIPLAVTPEDILRMQGKEVNMQNLNEEIVNRAQPYNPNTSSKNNKSNIRNLIDTLLVVLIFALKIGIVLVSLPIFIGTIIIGILWGILCLKGPELLLHSGIMDQDFFHILSLEPQLSWFISLTLIFATISWSCLFYGIIRSLFSRTNSQPTSNKTRLPLIIITLTSAILCIVFTIISHSIYQRGEENYDIAKDTINGVFMKDYDRERLERNAWTLCQYTNCNKNGKIYFNTSSLTEPDEIYKAMRFRKGDSPSAMQVHLKRSEYFPQGYYHVEAIAFSHGLGAYIYAQAEGDSLKTMYIPINDNGYGNLKQLLACKEGEGDSLKCQTLNPALQPLLYDEATAWSYISTPTFYHQGGIIDLGITNMAQVVHQPLKNSGAEEFGVYSVQVVADAAPAGTRKGSVHTGKKK